MLRLLFVTAVLLWARLCYTAELPFNLDDDPLHAGLDMRRTPVPHPDIEKDGYEDKFYIIVFSGPNCPYCERFKPIIAELKKDHKLYQFDYRKDKQVFQSMRVQLMPTTVFMKGGKEAHRFTGLKSRETYFSKAEQLKDVTPAPEPPEPPAPEPPAPEPTPEPLDYNLG